MDKKSTPKIPRGQMVYAPISSNQRISKSPFAQTNKFQRSRINSSQSNRKFDNEPYTKSLNNANHLSMQNTVIRTKSLNQLQDYVQVLLKQISLLKNKQQIYINKLVKLQEGLQKQHKQFMNLQELYTELFNSYKQKQQEIAQLQLRYKQTQREKNNNNFTSFKKDSNTNTINNSSLGPSMIQKMNSVKSSIQDNFKNQLTQLILQNKRLNQTNQKLITQLNYSKSKQKLNESRQNLQQKVFDNLQDWKSQIDIHKQEKIKIQYENKFLKIRIQDLQKNTIELQKIISLKQTQIIRMRQDRMNFRRQSSQKLLSKSPPKSGFDSSRSKSNNQNKKLVQLIQNLQKQNNQLRSENLTLKQKCKNLTVNKQNSFSIKNFNQNFQTLSISRKLQYQDKNSNDFHNKNVLKGHNENYNSQNTNQQYFSFSRQRQQKYSENSDLPTFPMDLEIQGIIQKHKGNIKAKLQNQNFLENKELLENI